MTTFIACFATGAVCLVLGAVFHAWLSAEVKRLVALAQAEVQKIEAPKA